MASEAFCSSSSMSLSKALLQHHSFCFVSFLFLATPLACGNSQARDEPVPQQRDSSC